MKKYPAKMMNLGDKKQVSKLMSLNNINRADISNFLKNQSSEDYKKAGF